MVRGVDGGSPGFRTFTLHQDSFGNSSVSYRRTIFTDGQGSTAHSFPRSGREWLIAVGQGFLNPKNVS
jgi:hypothetical protein